MNIFFTFLIFQCINDLLIEIKWLLPLAKAGPVVPFHLVRAGFIDAVSVNLKNINIKLTSVSNGFLIGTLWVASVLRGGIISVRT